MRQTENPLDNVVEHSIDDCWNISGAKTLSLSLSQCLVRRKNASWLQVGPWSTNTVSRHKTWFRLA